MKRIKYSNTSQEQKEFLDYAKWCGYDTMVCKGAEEAKAKISAFAKERSLSGYGRSS